MNLILREDATWSDSYDPVPIALHAVVLPLALWRGVVFVAVVVVVVVVVVVGGVMMMAGKMLCS